MMCKRQTEEWWQALGANARTETCLCQLPNDTAEPPKDLRHQGEAYQSRSHQDRARRLDHG